MTLAKISPVINKRVTAPLKNNVLRKLRVPALAAAMVLGGALANKAQAKELNKDTFTPTEIVVNDTIKPLSKGNVIVTDTIVVCENDTISVMDDLTKDLVKTNERIMGLSSQRTAAEELYTKVLSNISESGDNPYSAIYLALSEQENSGSSDVSSQMDDVIENMKLYSRDHNEETEELMKKDGSITEFHYGKDNSKTGTIFQTINISGINLNKDKDESSNDSIKKSNNDFNGNVSYRMKAVTDKAEVETNINAGSENVDIQFAAMYKTDTENGGHLSASANGRETMNGATTSGSIGASLDYNKKDFYTGVYYYYNREADEKGTNSKNSEVEGYLRYKQNIDLHAGIQNSDLVKYYYSQLNLCGTKNLENINTKLSGTLSAEVGSFNMDLSSTGEGTLKLTNLDFSAMGGAYFKTDDISASLNGRASYNYLIDPDGDNESNLSLSILGAFSKGSIAISAMFSMFKDLLVAQDSQNDSGVNIATSVGIEVKDLLKGISPQFSYTSTSIDNKVKHFFNVTVKTSLESLKKAQK